MLKKIAIPSSIGITAFMIVAVMLSQPVEFSEKNGSGLAPPAMSVYEITQLQEINEFTPNVVKSTVDLDPNETASHKNKSSNANANANVPHEKFAKHKDVAKKIGKAKMNMKILSNEDNSRTAILLSHKNISNQTTDAEFLYKDGGIWISIKSIVGTNISKSGYIDNLDQGFRIISVTPTQKAVIKSQGQVTQFGEVIDTQMVLYMTSDTDTYTIRGFITDQEAIKIADYLVK